jgi:hypothetical protein
VVVVVWGREEVRDGVGAGTILFESSDWRFVVGVDEDEDSPRTRARDNDGKVNVLECPFELVSTSSSLIVDSSLILSFSLSFTGLRRNGRASDGNLLKVDVDVDGVVVVDVVEGGTDTRAGDCCLPKGGVWYQYTFIYDCNGLNKYRYRKRENEIHIPLESMMIYDWVVSPKTPLNLQ